MTADSRNGEQWTAQLEADGSGAWEVAFPAPKDFPGTGIIAYGLTEKAAHLIAAAPDMLAMLQEIRKWMDKTWDAKFIDRIDALIAKAEART